MKSHSNMIIPDCHLMKAKQMLILALHISNILLFFAKYLRSFAALSTHFLYFDNYVLKDNFFTKDTDLGVWASRLMELRFGLFVALNMTVLLLGQMETFKR